MTHIILECSPDVSLQAIGEHYYTLQMYAHSLLTVDIFPDHVTIRTIEFITRTSVAKVILECSPDEAPGHGGTLL
jgi:hypothetical protein